MQHTYVHKDIGEYEEKIVGKLSARMLICIAAGLATSVASAAICHFGLGIAVADASLPIMATSMPFWLAGFWKPKGMRPEKFLPLAWRHLTKNGVLVYQSSASQLGLQRPLTDAALTACATDKHGKPLVTPRKLKKHLRKVGENYEPSKAFSAQA